MTNWNDVREIKQLRRDLGLTLAEFAQAAGIRSDSTISRWEAGVAHPSAIYRKQLDMLRKRADSQGRKPVSMWCRESVAKNVIQLRSDLGMLAGRTVSREELATKIEASYFSVWRWERGEQEPLPLLKVRLDALRRQTDRLLAPVESGRPLGRLA